MRTPPACRIHDTHFVLGGMQAVAELSIPGVVVNATDLELFAARDSNTWGDRMMCVCLREGALKTTLAALTTFATLLLHSF